MCLIRKHRKRGQRLPSRVLFRLHRMSLNPSFRASLHLASVLLLLAIVQFIIQPNTLASHVKEISLAAQTLLEGRGELEVHLKVLPQRGVNLLGLVSSGFLTPCHAFPERLRFGSSITTTRERLGWE